MRVLLVQALSVEEAAPEKVYPIGIVSLATHIQAMSSTVKLLDMNMQQDPFGGLKEYLLDFQPDVIGFSLRNIDPLGNKTSSLIPSFVVAIRLCKTLLPKSKIIVGGTGFSLFPERIMEELPEIDYGMVGEAETTFPVLLNSLERPPDLKGLCYRDGGKVKVTQPSKEFDMMTYLPPDRSLLDPTPYIKINSYVAPMGIETKRGCPFQCSYCVYPNLQGRKLRCRKNLEVIDEMEYLHRKYGIDRFHFTDPVLNIPAGHLEALCEEILRRGLKISWSGFFREDYLTEENVALFERAGCECFAFSPDGLSQEALDILGKNLRIEDILKAANLVAKSNVLSIYHFMVNTPGETETTINKGIGLLEKLYYLHSKKKNLGTVILNNIRILPGTQIEKIAREKGVIGPETDLLYPTYYNPGPFNNLRYPLETLHLCKNVFMWQEVEEHENSLIRTPSKSKSPKVQ